MSVQLMMGDCLERMSEIATGSVDLILTDPPYGTTACKWDAVIPFEPMWAQVWRVLKPNGAAVLFAAQPFTSALVMSQPQKFRYSWVWEKSKATSFLWAKRRPMAAHEDIIVFAKRLPSYFPQMTSGQPYSKGTRKDTVQEQLKQGKAVKGTAIKNESGERFPRTVQKFTTAEREGKLHPTQKPVALMEYLIRTYTNEGETVLDFTMGSGTTGVACVNTRRQFIGIERDPDYFQIARSRIDAASTAPTQGSLL